jgi:anti-sigma factor RsiW
MTTEPLAPDIGWEPSGHLSEVALTALADGEEALLDAAMHEHLGSCEACAAQLGEMAMRSARVAEALSQLPRRSTAPVIALPPDRPLVRERRKVPVVAIAAGLVVAALGAAPSLMSLPAEVEQTASVLRKVLPSLVRLLPQALARLWSGPTGPAALVVWGLSLALVATGFGIARKASRKAIVDGGRR